mmetsp:Transcript_25835/g.36538  ORF Transcript_25835/g.36538 Transcript_25835/m.36538 type:complete len:621 (+) Transcript_25835:730-2592(+)
MPNKRRLDHEEQKTSTSNQGEKTDTTPTILKFISGNTCSKCNHHVVKREQGYHKKDCWKNDNKQMPCPKQCKDEDGNVILFWHKKLKSHVQLKVHKSAPMPATTTVSTTSITSSATSPTTSLDSLASTVSHFSTFDTQPYVQLLQSITTTPTTVPNKRRFIKNRSDSQIPTATEPQVLAELFNRLQRIKLDLAGKEKNPNEIPTLSDKEWYPPVQLETFSDECELCSLQLRRRDETLDPTKCCAAFFAPASAVERSERGGDSDSALIENFWKNITSISNGEHTILGPEKAVGTTTEQYNNFYRICFPCMGPYLPGSRQDIDRDWKRFCMLLDYFECVLKKQCWRQEKHGMPHCIDPNSNDICFICKGKTLTKDQKKRLTNLVNKMKKLKNGNDVWELAFKTRHGILLRTKHSSCHVDTGPELSVEDMVTSLGLQYKQVVPRFVINDLPQNIERLEHRNVPTVAFGITLGSKLFQFFPLGKMDDVQMGLFTMFLRVCDEDNVENGEYTGPQDRRRSYLQDLSQKLAPNPFRGVNHLPNFTKSQITLFNQLFPNNKFHVHELPANWGYYIGENVIHSAYNLCKSGTETSVAFDLALATTSGSVLSEQCTTNHSLRCFCSNQD